MGVEQTVFDIWFCTRSNEITADYIIIWSQKEEKKSTSRSKITPSFWQMSCSRYLGLKFMKHDLFDAFIYFFANISRTVSQIEKMVAFSKKEINFLQLWFFSTFLKVVSFSDYLGLKLNTTYFFANISKTVGQIEKIITPA